jgi:hypothetical protein
LSRKLEKWENFTTATDITDLPMEELLVRCSRLSQIIKITIRLRNIKTVVIIKKGSPADGICVNRSTVNVQIAMNKTRVSMKRLLLKYKTYSTM